MMQDIAEKFNSPHKLHALYGAARPYDVRTASYVVWTGL